MGLFNIECDCGYTEEDVYLGRDEPMIPCPSCGGTPHKVFTNTVIHDHSFKPFDLAEGSNIRFETKEQFDAYVKRQEAKMGCPVQVEGFDAAKQKERADEIRHRAWLHRNGRTA